MIMIIEAIMIMIRRVIIIMIIIVIIVTVMMVVIKMFFNLLFVRIKTLCCFHGIWQAVPNIGCYIRKCFLPVISFPKG